MTTEVQYDRQLTDAEIDQFREISARDNCVRIDGPELRALVATLDRLQCLEQQNAELRQANDLAEAATVSNEATMRSVESRADRMQMALLQVRTSCVRWGDAGLVETIDAALCSTVKPRPEPLSPTVAIQVLARAVMALCRSNPGDAWQHMRQLGELGQEVR